MKIVFITEDEANAWVVSAVEELRPRFRFCESWYPCYFCVGRVRVKRVAWPGILPYLACSACMIPYGTLIETLPVQTDLGLEARNLIHEHYKVGLYRLRDEAPPVNGKKKRSKPT